MAAPGLPALIFCCAGSPSFRAVADECGWLNGARLPDTVYGGPLYFADQHYRAPDRAAYITALARHRPEVATVLDWERPGQWPEVLSWAEEAAQFVRRVVIIPKMPGTLDTIPGRVGRAEVVLGYSVPTSYGASPVPLWEFGRRPVHLLGGSPQRQLELAGYLNVVSCDGSMAHMQAHRCRYWRRRPGPKGRWEQLSEAGDKRQEGASMECFHRSLNAIRAAWEARATLTQPGACAQ